MNSETQQKINKLFEKKVRSTEELTKTLQMEDIRFAPNEFPAFGRSLANFGLLGGNYAFPEWLSSVFTTLVQGYTVNCICDPYAGIGLLVGIMHEATKAKSVIACTRSSSDSFLGTVLVGNAEWRVGNPIDSLNELNNKIDIAASILPWGLKEPRSLTVRSPDGYDVEIGYDLGQQILISASMHLSNGGIGIFIVTPSFFYSPSSVFHQLSFLGLGIQAAMELPSGTFAPQTYLPSYLVIISKKPLSRMFIAQLSSDSNMNFQILSNLANGKEGNSLELGRFVDIQSFKGLDWIRIREKIKETESHFGVQALSLERLATFITLGQVGESFQFPKQENAIFVPLIGISDTVDSIDDIKLKPQNYAQVVIDPILSSAHFVALFLNSELGKEIREVYKYGVIPKLNKQTLKELPIILPGLKTQKHMIETETRIISEQNILLGLQNELDQLRRYLWAKPQSLDYVDQQLSVLFKRFSGNIDQLSVQSFEQWFETLPFPLSSILRSWQATKIKDFNTKCDLLLDFFEATAKFLSIILMSAFYSNKALFEPSWQKLKKQKSGLKLREPTFGTWRHIYEHFKNETLELLNDEKEGRKLCMEMFADSSLILPKTITNENISKIILETNKMRNDVSHSPTPNEEEAQLLNEQLLCEVQKLREAMADVWTEIELIHSPSCVPRGGEFENEVAILMGSNSEFLREERTMATYLDAGYLYLSKKGSSKTLKLLPLVQIGPSPPCAKNACYFYKEVENYEFYFVSYHNSRQRECKQSYKNISPRDKMLVELKELLGI